MEPADSPVDNPLKGLVPYAGKSAERFPHSLEFDYLPLAKLLTGPGQYHWQSLDDKLVAISGRSCQAVFRIWLEFPGQPSGLPEYLAKAGVKVTEWKKAPDEFVWVRAGLTLRCSEAMGRMSAPVDPIKKPPGQALGGASSSGHPGLAPKQFLELVR